MKILINAANVRFGGGVTVAKNIIKSIIAQNEFDTIFLLLPQNAGYDIEVNAIVRIEYIADKFHTNYLYKTKFVRSGFSGLVDRCNPDIVFSLGNVAFSCKKPHLLLIQNAYLFYPESILWNRLPFKFKIYIKLANFQTKYYLKKADHYLVQTEVMKGRLSRIFNIAQNKINILPNVVSYQSKDIIRAHPIVPQEAKKSVKLLFLSKYYAHKNFDILIPLAEKIKKMGSTISISLTVSPEEHPFLQQLAQEVTHKGLGEIIKFIGNVPPDKINEVFIAHHGVFLPTLLESFSGTYIESMFYGRPVFTSDYDFAQIVCQNAAYYFDPLNADSIWMTISEAFLNSKKMLEKIELGYKIIDDLPRWEELSESIMQSIGQMLNQDKN